MMSWRSLLVSLSASTRRRSASRPRADFAHPRAERLRRRPCAALAAFALRRRKKEEGKGMQVSRDIGIGLLLHLAENSQWSSAKEFRLGETCSSSEVPLPIWLGV
jgi:hypothetical protein